MLGEARDITGGDTGLTAIPALGIGALHVDGPFKLIVFGLCLVRWYAGLAGGVYAFYGVYGLILVGAMLVLPGGVVPTLRAKRRI